MWWVIRTKAGRLLSSNESRLPFLFPDEQTARLWCMPGDTPEQSELRPVDRNGVVPLTD